MVQLTEVAASKVKEIMAQQNPAPTALRVAVVGGGCCGFSYHMAFDNQERPTDNVYQFQGGKVVVEHMNASYLDGVLFSYIETRDGAVVSTNHATAKTPSGGR